MKKIGILTFHRADNYGAVLQSYALCTVLNSFDVDVEIIDYKCEYIEKISRIKTLKDIVKLLFSGLYIYKSKSKFENFRKLYLNLSKEEYQRSNIKSTNENYDTFIVGSDQVWNYGGSNFDKTYFLDFVSDNKKKNSYAASFGFDSIPDSYVEEYKSLLSTFKNISVREESGKSLLKNQTDISSYVVLDPTLLLTAEIWKKIVDQPILNYDYLLIYSFSISKELYDCVVDVCNRTGLIPVCITNSIRPYGKIKKIKGVGPLEFINLFYYSKMIVTNSFHGTAFAVNFNKEFITETETGISNQVKARIVDLMEKTNIQNRFLHNYDLSKPIEYKKVNDILNEERKKSMEYIYDLVN